VRLFDNEFGHNRKLGMAFVNADIKVNALLKYIFHEDTTATNSLSRIPIFEINEIDSIARHMGLRAQSEFDTVSVPDEGRIEESIILRLEVIDETQFEGNIRAIVDAIDSASDPDEQISLREDLRIILGLVAVYALDMPNGEALHDSKTLKALIAVSDIAADYNEIIRNYGFLFRGLFKEVKNREQRILAFNLFLRYQKYIFIKIDFLRKKHLPVSLEDLTEIDQSLSRLFAEAGSLKMTPSFSKFILQIKREFLDALKYYVSSSVDMGQPILMPEWSPILYIPRAYSFATEKIQQLEHELQET
jgi:hypothetical protein